MRPDHSVCRWIYDNLGAADLHRYLKLPLVDISSVAACNPLTDIELTIEEQAELWWHLPFKQANYVHGRHVLSMEEFDDEEGTVEMYLFDPRVNLWGGAQVCRKELGPRGEMTNHALLPTLSEDALQIATMGLSCLKWVTHTGAHLVKVAPLERPSRLLSMTKKNRPWELPVEHYVFINLSEAKKYGHRIDRGGKHSSPIPHQRLGHYATLRAARWGNKVGQRIWRRPTWVGDKEWSFRGARYKVIDR